MYNRLLTHAKFSRSPKANLKSIHKYTVLQSKAGSNLATQGVFPPVYKLRLTTFQKGVNKYKRNI